MRYILPLALLIGLFLSFGSQKPSTNLSLKVLDIGQGDSIYIRTPNQEDILIDAGPDDRVVSQLGQAMPMGDRTIELFIVSHNHLDHIGGLKALLEQFTIKEIWLSGAVHTTDQYLEMLQLIKDRAIPTSIRKAGDQFISGETDLTVLHPIEDMTGQLPDDQHDATVVTKLSYHRFCAILTGDINTGHEESIIEVAKQLDISLNCPVLKIAHHGSASGTGQAFLDIVQPQLALISVGAKNRYGHPAPSLLNRLEENRIQTYRTDQNGTITVTTDGATFWTKTEK